MTLSVEDRSCYIRASSPEKSPSCLESARLATAESPLIKASRCPFMSVGLEHGDGGSTCPCARLDRPFEWVSCRSQTPASTRYSHYLCRPPCWSTRQSLVISASGDLLRSGASLAGAQAILHVASATSANEMQNGSAVWQQSSLDQEERVLIVGCAPPPRQ